MSNDKRVSLKKRERRGVSFHFFLINYCSKSQERELDNQKYLERERIQFPAK